MNATALPNKNRKPIKIVISQQMDSSTSSENDSFFADYLLKTNS